MIIDVYPTIMVDEFIYYKSFMITRKIIQKKNA